MGMHSDVLGQVWIYEGGGYASIPRILVFQKTKNNPRKWKIPFKTENLCDLRNLGPSIYQYFKI